MDVVSPEGCTTFARKRRPRKRLRVNERVEVRSQETDFLGSWHQGIVIASGNRKRCIKYDHILDEDGSMMEHVEVPPAVDGVDKVETEHCNYRGFIRPLPPYFVSGPYDLHYGLCVDVYYMEAWWEGVIFDHNDGAEERIVFFPDQGDEMSIRLANIRVTMIWNEVTEGWSRRGAWMFLELIEETKQEWPLPVSVKQIWYDLRERPDYIRILEWTSTNEALWQDLILKTISMNLEIALRVAVPQLLMTGNIGVGICSGMPDEPKTGDFPQTEKFSEGCLGSKETLPSSNAVPTFSETSEAIGFDNNRASEAKEADRTHTELRPQMSQSPITHHDNSRQRPVVLSVGLFPGFPLEEGKANQQSQRNNVNWQLVLPDMVSGIGPYPKAIATYIEGNKGMKHNHPLILEVRKHFMYLGWKVQFRMDTEATRFRYISPNGKSYMSLVKACIAISRPKK